MVDEQETQDADQLNTTICFKVPQILLHVPDVVDELEKSDFS